MSLLDKSQEKHPGVIPPMVSDLPLHPNYWLLNRWINVKI